jgi:glycosyltransferase involved in cell wall biosynthesis
MQPNPLLTIAIPTYNRSSRLDLTLSILVPQVLGHPDVEILVSDNSSPDDTFDIVQRYLDPAHPNIRYQRHSENIGSDANFISCYDNASGKYFWLCGDDDIVIEGALDRLIGHLHAEDYDLIFAHPYSFHNDHIEEYRGDLFNRRYHTITDAHQFAMTVNIMFTFISGIIVNKERLDEFPHEPFASFINTNLVQLSWVLPLLRTHRRSLVLWQRVVAGRGGHASGYSFGEVFGKAFFTVTKRLLPDQPHLVRGLMNVTLRTWFPGMIYELRRQGNQNCHMEDAPGILRRYYGNNFRYWLFAYPIFKLPLPLARIWVRAAAILNKLLLFLAHPGFWRKEIRSA